MVAVVLAATGCSKAPRGNTSGAVLLYCADTVRLQANALRQRAEAAGHGQVIVAPLAPGDLIGAIEGTQAGDFVLFAGDALRRDLAQRRLSPADAVPMGFLGILLVAARPMQLEDLRQPGLRLGCGTSSGLLGRLTEEALPTALRQAIETNVVHRSERADELLRLLRLGALDAVFVWDSAALPGDGLHRLPLTQGSAQCPVWLAPLSASRLRADRRQALLNLWLEGERPPHGNR